MISRRDFIKLSALTTAAAAAGIAKPSEILAFPTVKTLPLGQCRYCAVGCTMVGDFEVDAAGKVVKALAMKGDIKSPVNRGVICTKAFYLHKALAYKDRPQTPLIRKEWIDPKTGKPSLTASPRVLEGRTTKDPIGLEPSEVDMKKNFVPVSWEDAIEFVTTATEKSIKDHTTFSIAYYGSGQAGSEETHIMNKALKGGILNNAVEGQPRMCMASAVVGYLHTFGKDEPYGSLDDLDVPDPDFGVIADTFFIIGANMAEAHPIPFNRVAAVKAKDPDKVKVILADPRKTRSGTIADLWLPFASGRDLVLLNTLAHIIAFELDGAKVDIEKGKVTTSGKYLDLKFIKRHCNFAINEKVEKHWVLTEYGGARDKAWDLSYDRVAKVYPDPKKKYATESEIEADWERGFATFLKFLEDHKPEKMARLIFEGEPPLLYDRATKTWKEVKPEEALRLAAKWMAEGNLLSAWTMGVNQKVQGTWTNATLHMLNLITGKTVKPGRHSFSFTGQPNACGGIRAPGALSHALPYGRLVAVDIHRTAVEKLWKDRNTAYLKKIGMADADIAKENEKIKIHPKPGPHTIEMFRRLGAGQIKMQFICAVNPGQSLPYAYPYRLAMASAEKGTPWPIVTLLEAFPGSTSQVADIVLPCASFYEKEYIFGNLERRYQLIKKTIDPVAPTMIPDTVIFASIWRRMEEKGIIAKGYISQFWPDGYEGDDWLKRTLADANKLDFIRAMTGKVWEELMELSRGTGYDFTAMTKKRLLEQNHGYRIPFPAAYDTDADVKARYDKYESRIVYAWPYDPVIGPRTKFFMDNLKAWNPVYAGWVEKHIEEMKKDTDYHKKEKVPAGWYASFYHSNAAIHGFEEIKDAEGKLIRKVPRWDGRALIWANPWWAHEFDGKAFKRLKEVKITERKFNAKKVAEGETVAPYDVVKTYKGTVIGDPEKDHRAILAISLSPAEFEGYKMSYMAEGKEVVISDCRGYPIGACTGRVLEHWHSGSMTTRVPELSRAVPGAYVEIHEKLAKKLGIKEGDSVIVETIRGKIELPAKILDPKRHTGGPRSDYVFMPWFDEYKNTSMLVRDNFDPFSFQADYKMFAAKVYKGKTKTRQAEPGKIVA